jgi:hypothetical protein
MPIDPSIPLRVLQNQQPYVGLAERRGRRLQQQAQEQSLEMNEFNLAEARRKQKLMEQMTADEKRIVEIVNQGLPEEETYRQISLIDRKEADAYLAQKRKIEEEKLKNEGQRLTNQNLANEPLLKQADLGLRTMQADTARQTEQRQQAAANQQPTRKQLGTFVDEQNRQMVMFQNPDGTFGAEPVGSVLPKAADQPTPGTDIPYSPEVEAQKRRISASQGGPEPLVAIMGPDGRPVLVPRSQAVGKQPASSREQGRAVTSGDAGRIADFDTSLDDLAELRTAIPAGSTGTIAKVGTMLPNPITEFFGWTGPKEKQAVIDRVKQVIGKALEGGVLRKEDEVKYEKILPTIYDNQAVAKSKLDGLERAITQRRLTLLDSLDDAGYDVGQYHSRTTSGPSGKKLDEETARRYLQSAGGDKTKARELAKRDGYSF